MPNASNKTTYGVNVDLETRTEVKSIQDTFPGTTEGERLLNMARAAKEIQTRQSVEIKYQQFLNGIDAHLANVRREIEGMAACATESQQAALADFESKNAEYIATIAAQQNELSNLRARLKATEEIANEATAEAKSLRADKDILLRNVSLTEENTVLLRNEMNRLEEENKRLRTEHAELETQISALQAENKELSEEVAAFKIENDTLRSKLRALEEGLDTTD